MAMDSSLIHPGFSMDPPWLRAADGGRHCQEILRQSHPTNPKSVTYPWSEVE